MAQPVWVLSVDLQTKTATFQSGMSEAAKSARGAFTDIKSGANSMGTEVSGNMMRSRQGVMLLGEEFGVHLPRGLITFIASLGPVGAAMEAAFPFVAIAVGASLLLEHLAKMREEGRALTQDQIKFGTAAQNAFNTLDEKILSSQIKADELRNDHLGALAKQLVLIDKQSMAELVHSFEEVAKAADVVLGGLKASWYQFGTGARGAQNALTDFQNQYASLLSQGKEGSASDLLKGTLDSARKILAAQQQAKSSLSAQSGAEGTDVEDQIKYAQASAALKQAGVGYTEKEVKAQQALVEALQAQVGIEERVATLKKQDSANTTRSAQGAMSAEASAAAKQAADAQLHIGEQAIEADRAMAEARLDIQRASIQEHLQNDIAFAGREYAAQMAGNGAQIEALDKLAKDYPNELKALHEKAEELTAEHAAKVAEMTAKAQIAQNAQDLATFEEGEREKIEATQKGSAARVAALDSAIKEETARNMQDLSSYRDLLTQRVEAVRQMAEEEAKLEADAGKESADNALKMGQLMLAASKQAQALADSSHRVTIQQRMQEELTASNQEYALKLTAMQQEAAALDKSDKDYQNKLKEAQDKERQLVQEHENELTAIKDKAEEERNTKILAAEQRAASMTSAGLTQSIMGHQTWAHMISSFAEQAASELIQNSLMVMMQQDKERLSNARAAATSAYATGEKIGGPAGIILGPIFAASAFAGVMAFESGGVVPGIGRGDIVPAMLEPGEGVIKNSAMDKINRGEMGNTTHYHAHVNPTYHLQALDTDGMEKVLDNHAGTLQKHVETTLRKMNK